MQRAHFLGIVVLFSSLCLCASEKGDIVKQAVEKSQLTLPGSRPFHLKAIVIEGTNPDNDEYKAEIEEYWVAPDKWRRVVKSPEFSQTIVVNGTKVYENDAGDYYPNWLRTIVDAIFDPGRVLEGVDLSKSSDNPLPASSELCRRFAMRAGIPPVGNNVFSSYCFKSGLISSVGIPGYHAEYKEYRNFGDKKVARIIGEYIEPGTELQARIEQLDEISNPDESLFQIQQVSELLQTRYVQEDTLWKLLMNPPTMSWPTVRAGKTKGVLSMYVCLDRKGKVREIYDLNSDHPEMSDAARKQVMGWSFHPASNGGAPVQVEGILTFAYESRIDDPIPVLAEDEARKQAIKIVEPEWPSRFAPAGTPITLTASVDEAGVCRGITGITTDKQGYAQGILGVERLSRALPAINKAVDQWRFHPYVRNGVATIFTVRITFHVQ